MTLIDLDLIKPPLFVCKNKKISDKQLAAIEDHIKNKQYNFPEEIEKTEKEKLQHTI